MNGTQTGKQRASRIPLDYYKRPDGIQRWKVLLAGIALVGAICWWVSGLARPDQGGLLYSRGPVAKVHQAWNADCAACHVSFAPMGTQSGISRVIGNAHSSDQLCSHCHAGPPHSSKQIDAEVQACADCHRDHRGPDADLLAMADSGCVNCHADLAKHMKPDAGKPDYADVGRYAPNGNHPEFRAVKEGKDPGHLLFNHKVHLTAGMGGNEKQKPLYALKDIENKDERERYRAMQPANLRNDTDAVQLNCAACHVADSGDVKLAAGQALPPTRSGGAYMQPFSYDNNCKACHPLTLGAGEEKGKPLTVPHRLQPAQVHDYLEQSLLARLAADKETPLLEEPFVPLRTLPGKAPATPVKEKIRAVLDKQVETAEKVLFLGKQTCGECHMYVGNSEIKPGATPKFTIAPDDIPDVWFPHGRFDHTAHRAVDCLQCHGNAPTSKTASDVLVPGIQNCLQCHAPAGATAAGPQGGVRFGCTECHRYHHGDAPLHGSGAAARGVKDRMTIQQFLSGGGAR